MFASTVRSLRALAGAACLLAGCAAVAGTGGRSIVDFGAVPDGVTPSTAAINRAIDDAARGGGGTVFVPAGRFLTGTIYLKSHVTLLLDNGAELLGSTELRDYPENPAPAPQDTPEFRRVRHLYPANLEFGRFSLIYAAGQHDVAVCGHGRINGQGSHPNFGKKQLRDRGVSERDAYLNRPYGLCFVGCTNVRVRDVTIVDVAFWAQDYLDCDGVLVEGVSVDSRKNDANNDGIDVDGSRHVRVNDCSFNTGDDSICLKSSYRDCEDITISNCTCSSLANGVKFGTASNGGFRNVAVTNIAMTDVNAAGLALEVVDGGTMDGVVISNITMSRVGAPIFLRLGDRGRRWMKPEDGVVVGRLRNVSISNVVATADTPMDARPLSGSIAGLPGHPVENVTISNVRIVNRRPHPADEVAGLGTQQVGEHADEYPEYSMFGPLPSHGLYVRHARGVTLRNIELKLEQPDLRSALVFDDVEDLAIDGLRADTYPGSQPVLQLRNVRRALVSGGVAAPGTGVFVRAEGATSGVLLQGNDLKGARSRVSLGDGVPADAIVDRDRAP